MRQIAHVCRGCILTAFLAGAVGGDEGLSLSVGESRILVAVQRHNWLWVYWPDAVVMDPMITAHHLPDLKPVWSHTPETFVSRTVIRTADRPGGPEQRSGIVYLHLTANMLIYSGEGEPDYASVAVDRQSGEVRYHLPVWPISWRSDTPGLSDRWMVTYKGNVFDVATGAEVAQLSGFSERSFRFIHDSVVYLTYAAPGSASIPNLRRVRLPSGEVDTDLDLRNVLGDSAERLSADRILMIWKDLAILELSDRSVDRDPTNPRRLAAINLATGQHAWTTAVMPHAPLIFLTHDAEAPVLPADGRPSPFFERNRPVVPVPIAQASYIAVDLTTGEQMFGSHIRHPHEMLIWHGVWQTNPPNQVTFTAEQLWTLFPSRSNELTNLMCLDLTTGELLWRTQINGLSNPQLAKDDPRAASNYLVVSEVDAVHVLRRDTGEQVGKITPHDVGATIRPPDRPPRGTMVEQPPPVARFLAGPWLERWLIALPAVPLMVWLLWHLARRAKN